MIKMTVLLLAALACWSGVSAADGTAGALPFAAAVKENGKWGVSGRTGRLVVPARYDAAAVSLSDKEIQKDDRESMPGRENLIEVRQGKLRGFYSRDGKVIVPVSYVRRSSWTEGMLAAENEQKKIAFFKEDGTALSGYVYDEASDFKDGMALVKRGGKYGYLRADGREIAPAYKEARPFAGGAAPVKNGKWGVIDTSGKMVVPFQYDNAGPFFSGGLLAVEKDNRWGFIDAGGREVVPLVWRAVHPVFSEGITAVENEKRLWGFLNEKGEITASPRFKEVLTPMSEGLAGVMTEDGKAYAGSDGTIAFHAGFDRIYPFRNGLAEYREGELVERRVTPVISIGWGWGWGRWHRHPYGWDWPMWGPWWYDGTVTDREVKRGYLDKTGRIIASASLEHVYPASEKGILVFNDGRFGWIAPSGQYTIHTAYRQLIPIDQENLVIAKNDRKDWGLLTFTGNTVLPFSYDAVTYLGKGRFAVKQGGKWGLAGSDGTILAAPVFRNMGIEGNGLFPAKTKNGWIYLDMAGKEAISFADPPEEALFFKDGGAGIKVHGKWGIIGPDGQWTAEPRFDQYMALYKPSGFERPARHHKKGRGLRPFSMHDFLE